MIQNTRIDRQERGLMRANMETGGIPVTEERERHSAPGMKIDVFMVSTTLVISTQL